MLELRLARRLAAPPARVWPFVAEPALMNRWSKAEIQSIALGDGGHPGGTGALRRVRIPGPPKVILDEVIERAEAPYLLEYRVLRGAPVRHHLGRITLRDAGDGCELVWQVDIEMAARALERLAEQRLRSLLEASLDALSRCVVDDAGPAALPPPPHRELDERTALPLLRLRAIESGEAQRLLADRLLAAGDDRGWFARIYQHVTGLLLDAGDAGRFSHPGWPLRLIPVFHAYYDDNLRRRLGELPGEVEAHWARAFATTERARGRGRSPYEAAMLAIFVGMRAHIEDDLPRTLARVWAGSYGDRADYVRFRADYLRMGDVFTAAAERVLLDLPSRGWAVRARLLERLTPRDLRGWMMERTFYPIARRRSEAFERGAGIARLLAENERAA